MTVSFDIVKQNPQCIEHIVCEDVAEYTISDLGFIVVKFNNGTKETFITINTQDKQNGDFTFISTNVTRVPMKIEM